MVERSNYRAYNIKFAKRSRLISPYLIKIVQTQHRAKISNLQ